MIGITLPGADTEYPRAYVVGQPSSEGQKLTEQELQEYVLTRRGVKFVGSIARNPSGKILKRVIREEAKRESEAGQIKPRL